LKGGVTVPTLLKKLKIKTLGSVDRPANQNALAVLFKRAEEPGEKGGGNTDDQKLTEKAVTFLKGLLDRITKGAGDAKDFASLLGERQREELMWDMTYAFRESIDSILNDPEVTDKKTAIANTLQQFFIALTASNLVKGEKIDITKVGRKISQPRMDMLKQMKDLLEKLIAEAEVIPDETGLNKNQGGSNVPDKITLDMLPEDVRKAVEAIPILKQENEELKKQLETTTGELTKTKTDLTKAQEDLAKAQEEQKKREYITKAAGFKNLSTNAEELGTLLKAVAENKATPEDVQKLEGLLKAADEAISKGNLFGEIGRSGGGAVPGSALEKFNQMVDALVQKDGKLSMADAISKVAREHPDLYDQYIQETTVVLGTKNKGQ